jgi:hypothetical protein
MTTGTVTVAVLVMVVMVVVVVGVVVVVVVVGVVGSDVSLPNRAPVSTVFRVSPVPTSDL